MKPDKLDQKIQVAQERLHRLLQRQDTRPTRQPQTATKVIQEISIALEELHATSEEIRQRDEQLAVAEQRVAAERQALFELAPEGCLVTDVDAVVRETNRAADALLKASKKNDVIGTPLMVFVPNRERKTFLDHLARLRKRRAVERWDTSLQPRTGEPVQIAVTVAPGPPLDGTDKTLRWLLQDITERKRMESHLATQYAVARVLTEAPTLAEVMPKLLQAIGESTGWDVGVFWVVDESAGVLRCAGVWEQLPGTATAFAEEIRPLTIPSGVGLPGQVWATGRPAWLADVKDAVDCPAAPIAVRSGLRGVFGFPLCTDDMVRGILVYLSRQARQPSQEVLQLIEALGGQIGQFIARRQTEEELRLKTGQLNVINESLTCIVESGNWQKACTTLLRAALGQTESEYGFIGPVVDGPVLRILAHEGVQWDQTVNRELYEAAQRLYREKGYLEFTNFDNLFGRVITSGQAVVSNDPQTDPRSGGLPPGHPPLRCFLGVPVLKGTEVVGMIGIANRAGGYTGKEQEQIVILTQAAGALFDSYRRQQEQDMLEQLLRQAEKMAAMGTLIAGVSHEINNPLFALSGYLELASKKVRSGEREGLAEDLAAMKEAAERATAMVRRFLGVARSPAWQREPCAVNAGVEQGLELVANDCLIHGISISRDLASDLPFVEADSQELLQALLNLFTNARQAMAAQGRGTLTVTTALAASPRHPVPPSASSGAWVEIRVQDDGPGIAPEHVGRVFEPFFTTKPVGEGTGLGLSTSHRIVTEHGGTITCQSKPGRGATFMIRLPAGAGDQSSAFSGQRLQD